MSTVYASLPFYDSLVKQDKNRTGAVIPFHCPRHQLPPFLINAGSDTIGTVDEILLVTDCESGNLISEFANDSYDVFGSTGTTITSAIVTSGAGTYFTDSSPVNSIKIREGESISVNFNLTLNSGATPLVFLIDVGTGIVSNTAGTSAGANEIILVATATGIFNIRIQNTNNTNFSTDSITVGRRGLDITSYFETLPAVIAVGSDYYIEYEGDTLNTILPTGSYYIQLSGGNSIFYSDWIRISNIYKNLISTLENSTYDTLSTSLTTVISAISDGTGASFGNGVESFTVARGEVITVIFNLTLNSGVAPTFTIREISAGGSAIASLVVATAGLNEIELTATKSATAFLSFKNGNGDAGNWSATQIWAMRQYSPNFIKLAFGNTNDIGNILYSTGYSQEVWLQSRLNNPSHEITEIGDEKDGIFIAEKVVTSFMYSIIGYISRGLYNCLIRMPQSDSITITDEVGTTYTPDVGNVIIEPIDWVYYETGKITILFNDGSNSAFKWTSNLDNLI